MQRCNRSGERGIALISALLLLTLFAMLTASAVALAQFAAAETDANSTRLADFYRAESALNRAMLLLAADRQRHAGRTLGAEDAAADPAEERFMADGVEHHLDDDVSLRITDAACGLDVSGNAPSRQLPQGDGMDAAFLARRDLLAARLDDYVDADDFLRKEGMEAQHYRSQGIPQLPRNRPMQYREELRWIPGAAEFFPADADGILSSARLIAPKGLRPLPGRPNLYSASPELIAMQCNLEPGEQEALRNAMRQWRTARKPLTETLPPGLYGKLSIRFSIHESGIYTITVQSPGCRLSATFQLGSADQPFEFYEFLTR